MSDDMQLFHRVAEERKLTETDLDLLDSLAADISVEQIALSMQMSRADVLGALTRIAEILQSSQANLFTALRQGEMPPLERQLAIQATRSLAKALMRIALIRAGALHQRAA